MKLTSYLFKTALMALCINLAVAPAAQGMQQRWQEHEQIKKSKRRTNVCAMITGALAAFTGYMCYSFGWQEMMTNAHYHKAFEQQPEVHTKAFNNHHKPALKTMQDHAENCKNVPLLREILNMQKRWLIEHTKNSPRENVSINLNTLDCNNWWLHPYCEGTLNQITRHQESFSMMLDIHDKHITKLSDTRDHLNQKLVTASVTATGSLAALIGAALYTCIISEKYSQNLQAIREHVAKNPESLKELNKAQRELLFKFALQAKDAQLCQLVFPHVADSYNFLLEMLKVAKKADFKAGAATISRRINAILVHKIDKVVWAAGINLTPGVPQLIADYVESTPMQESARQAELKRAREQEAED